MSAFIDVQCVPRRPLLSIVQFCAKGVLTIMWAFQVLKLLSRQSGQKRDYQLVSLLRRPIYIAFLELVDREGGGRRFLQKTRIKPKRRIAITFRKSPALCRRSYESIPVSLEEPLACFDCITGAVKIFVIRARESSYVVSTHC